MLECHALTVQDNIKQDASQDEQKEVVWRYWLNYVPNASWGELAGKLHYKGEKEVLEIVKKYFERSPGTDNKLKPVNMD